MKKQPFIGVEDQATVARCSSGLALSRSSSLIASCKMDADLQHRIEAAARRLVEHGATAVYVFGSAVTGHMRRDSDVDIAVTGLPAAVFYRAMAEATRIVGRPVDLLALDRGDELARSLMASGDLQRVA